MAVVLDASFSGAQIGRFAPEWVYHNIAIVQVWHSNGRTEKGLLFNVGAQTTQEATH